MGKAFVMHHVQVRGSSRERGQAHGEALRPLIRELTAQVGEMIKVRGFSSPGAFFEKVLNETGLIAAAERWTADLVDEAEGIAEGSATDRKTILAMQLLEELDWLSTQMTGGGCTVLGANPYDGHPALLAQNADNPAFLEGYQTLLELEDPGTGWRAMVLTFPGLIGAYGVNNNGVGVCINEMVGAMATSPQGLGTLFVSRGILAQSSFSQAVAFLNSVPHASGNTFTIGSAEQVVAFEAAPGEVVAFHPSELPAVTCHTNHPLVNRARCLLEDFPGVEASHQRLVDCQRRLARASRPITVGAVREILSSHDSHESPICRHDATRMSFIVEFRDTPVLHVAPGPPCMTAFRSFVL